MSLHKFLLEICTFVRCTSFSLAHCLTTGATNRRLCRHEALAHYPHARAHHPLRCWGPSSNTQLLDAGLGAQHRWPYHHVAERLGDIASRGGDSPWSLRIANLGGGKLLQAVERLRTTSQHTAFRLC
jgi:hypothetical protein